MISWDVQVLRITCAFSYLCVLSFVGDDEQHALLCGFYFPPFCRTGLGRGLFTMNVMSRYNCAARICLLLPKLMIFESRGGSMVFIDHR